MLLNLHLSDVRTCSCFHVEWVHMMQVVSLMGRVFENEQAVQARSPAMGHAGTHCGSTTFGFPVECGMHVQG